MLSLRALIFYGKMMCLIQPHHMASCYLLILVIGCSTFVTWGQMPRVRYICPLRSLLCSVSCCVLCTCIEINLDVPCHGAYAHVARLLATSHPMSQVLKRVTHLTLRHIQRPTTPLIMCVCTYLTYPPTLGRGGGRGPGSAAIGSAETVAARSHGLSVAVVALACSQPMLDLTSRILTGR